MNHHNFKKLKIWERSMNLTNLTFEYCKDLPKEERYNLIDQINRCSCSIPSNIAEGSGKRTKLQFGEYLSISISSSYELETQLLICQQRNYGNQEQLKLTLKELEEIQKMIFSFRSKVLALDS
jgi:four helix bundle protein